MADIKKMKKLLYFGIAVGAFSLPIIYNMYDFDRIKTELENAVEVTTPVVTSATDIYDVLRQSQTTASSMDTTETTIDTAVYETTVVTVDSVTVSESVISQTDGEPAVTEVPVSESGEPVSTKKTFFTTPPAPATTTTQQYTIVIR